MQLDYTWLPACTSTAVNPLRIIKAENSYLITDSGLQLYDAISSWWCKPLGHQHALVRDSIYTQLDHFEHHIAANAYNDTLEELSSRLAHLSPNIAKVMYASDGSSAIEIAMKLSYKTRVINNQRSRSKFVALKGGYHGETLFALSVCGITAYTATYANLLWQNYFIDDICYVNSRFDPLWNECNFAAAKYNDFLAKIAPHTSALIIEPVVQGAAGMKIISRDFLTKLVALAKKYDIHIISDEIMVGLGRLGCFCVSSEILNFGADFICLAKNLTAGSIPMSAVMIHAGIADRFKHKVFNHSHTHSGNAIGARVALNYLKYCASSSLLQEVNSVEIKLLELMQSLAAQFTKVRNPRAIGAIAACELTPNSRELSISEQIFNLGTKHSIYLRPINHTLYIMPPLYNLNADLAEIKSKLFAVLSDFYQ